MTRSVGSLLMVLCILAPEMAAKECPLEQVRKELEAQYARLADANRRKDLAGILALRAPDCGSSNPEAGRFSCQQMADYSRRLIEEVVEVKRLSNAILDLELDGNQARATVLQQFARTQRKAGQVRNIETMAVQRETWVRTREGWKLKLVDNIHGRRWYVDGKRVDPKKPYNPDDPPYNPALDADE